MSDLNRTQVGSFNIQESCKIEEIKSGDIKRFISIEEFFKYNNKIILNTKEMNHFLNGVKLTKKIENGLYRIYDINNVFIGIGIAIDNTFKRDIIIN